MRARTSHFTHFQRHAGKFTPAKQGVVERRETKSPITFSISGRYHQAFFGSSLHATPAGTRADYQRMRVRLPFFFSSFLSLSPPRLICYSLTRHISRWALCAEPLRRERIIHCGELLYTGVDWNAKVPVAFVHPIQVITKYSDWCCYTYPSWIDSADKTDGRYVRTDYDSDFAIFLQHMIEWTDWML